MREEFVSTRGRFRELFELSTLGVRTGWRVRGCFRPSLNPEGESSSWQTRTLCEEETSFHPVARVAADGSTHENAS